MRFEIRHGETVGTGSHPKLTGREHIYQNDAILAMNRAEVKRKYVQMAFSAPLFVPESKS